MLADRQATDPAIPVELTAALREWAEVAVAVRDGAPSDQRELVRRRGRQLAGWLAQVRGRPVVFVDPLTGIAESVAVRDTVPTVRVTAREEPTPWSTGLPVAAFFAVLAAIGDIALCRTFAAAFGALWVPANVLVTAGLAPSLWMLRSVRFWRWPALGTAVGLGVAWLVLLLGSSLT